jgi:hypothetical protein
MEVSDQLHAAVALPPGKQSPVPLYRRLGRPQSGYGRYGEEKNPLPLPRTLIPRLSSPQHGRYTG